MEKNNNKTIITVIIVGLILIGGYFIIKSNNGSEDSKPGENTVTQATPTTGASGTAVFSARDAATNMNGVTEVNMTVSKVEIHNSADTWVTAFTGTQTFDLLKLKAEDKNQLLAKATLPDGTYDQVRLTVDKITVKDATGIKEAKLPSGVLKINTQVVVADGKTTSVNFDFIADQSLHLTGNGVYIFAPVIHVQSKSDATVGIDESGKVTIAGGHTDSDVNEGMDVSGEIKSGFKLDEKADFDTSVDGVIKTKGLLNK